MRATREAPLFRRMPTQRSAAAAMATTTEDALTVIKKAGRAKALAALSAAAAVVPGDVGGTARSIAIVQWTHTLTMKPMLLAARQQIAPYAPRVEHHVVLSVCGRGKESNATACDDMLAKAHPLTENVTCVWPLRRTRARVSIAHHPAASAVHASFSASC